MFDGVEARMRIEPTLFGLDIVGLEKHLLGSTGGIVAPTLAGLTELIPLLLYAGDPILIPVHRAHRGRYMPNNLPSAPGCCESLHNTNCGVCG